jgi:hypothetical protein
MSDEFDSIMAQAFDPDSFDSEDSIVDHGILPTTVDNHMAVHLLEAEMQLAIFLYAQEYAIDSVEPEAAPGLERALRVGLMAYNNEYRHAHGAQEFTPEAVGDAVDTEFLAWVRLSAGQLALALERFLAAHGLDRVTVMVHLSGHGWYPFTIGAGFGRRVDG